MQNTNNALNQAKRRAMKLAEFRLTHEREQKACENDLVNNMGASPEEARLITSAYRAQVLPAVAQYEGLDEADYEKLVRLSGISEMMTADFAKDTDEKSENDLDELDEMDEMDEAEDESLEDEIAEHGHIPTSEEEALEGETPEMHSPEVEEAIDNADADAEDGDMGFDDADAMTGPFGPDGEFENDGSEDLRHGGTGTATFEVDIPKELVDEFQQLIVDFKAKHEGGDDLDTTDLDASAAPAFGGATGDETDSATKTEDNFLPLNEAASRKMHTPMENQVMAKRRAMRNEILRLAQSQNIAEPKTPKRDVKHGDDTTSGTYMGEKATPISKATDAQYHNEKTFPTHQLEGSEGNSLKGDNPTFGKLKIPTRNPQNLGLKDSYEAVRKEGDHAGDDVLSYEVDLDNLNWVPSKDPGREQPVSIPTQMEQRDRNTNGDGGARQASVNGYSEKEIGDFEDALFTALASTGMQEEQIGKLTLAQAVTQLGQRAASAADVAIEVNAEDCEPEIKGIKHGDDFKREPHKTDGSRTKEASSEVFQARLKTAWAITAKLCRAGLLTEEDMESNVNMWMTDNMSVQTMLSTGTQFLKMAQSASERVLEAAATRNQPAQRTASVATNPVLMQTAPSANANYGGQRDLEQALRSVLSNSSEYERYEDELREKQTRRF